MQQTDGSDVKLRNLEVLSDLGQLRIEHPGKAQQVLALPGQGEAHRANPGGRQGLPPLQFGHDEVEELAPVLEMGAGLGEHVPVQPADQDLHLAGQAQGPGLGPAGVRQGPGQPTAPAFLLGLGQTFLKLALPGGSALGLSVQRLGQGLAPVLDVEQVPMARDIAQGGSLPGPQPRPGIGNAELRREALGLGVQEMDSPGGFVPVFLLRQQVTICRGRVDAGEHGAIALENLVVEADANAGQILRRVDSRRLLSGGFQQGVDGPEADRGIQHVPEEADDTSVGAMTDQDQAYHELIQPRRRDREIKQHLGLGRDGRKRPGQRRFGLALLTVEEGPADLLPGGDMGDRFGPG